MHIAIGFLGNSRVVWQKDLIWFGGGAGSLGSRYSLTNPLGAVTNPTMQKLSRATAFFALSRIL